MRILHSVRSNQRRGIVDLAWVALLALVISISKPSPGPAARTPVSTVYFYNPEISVSNYASLRIEFDTYLASVGAFRFQPFSDQATFEKFVRTETNGVFFLSSWHYRQLRTALPIEPVLVGLYKGKATQRRALAAKKDILSTEQLRGATVASAGTEAYTLTVIREILGREKESIAPTLRVLTVPKEMDALMSVGFGMARAALTTESSLEKLSAVNPKQRATIGLVAVSEEVFLPLIVTPKAPGPDVASLIAAMQEMGRRPDGQDRLRLIGLDGLRRLSKAEVEGLVR